MELRLRAIGLLYFCRDVIFLTRIGVISCSKFAAVLFLFSRSPSLSSSSESYFSYSQESKPDSFPEKPLLEIGVYYDLWSRFRPKKKLQNILSRFPLRGGRANFTKLFFSAEEDIGYWNVFCVMN